MEKNKPLITKYRPDDFDSVVGNSSVVNAIKKAISSDSRPHSYIFSGPPGCGKTTLARICAKRFGAIGMGVRETNAADMTGIDSIREILSECRGKAAGSRSTVYILDEGHKLSAAAQNGLLKILEDPPYFVYFIICTTDKAKLIPAIKSRCTAFDLKKLDFDDAAKLLLKICGKEGVDLPGEVGGVVLQSSDGHPRMILNNLDRVRECKTAAEAKKLVSNINAEFSLYEDFLKIFYKKNPKLVIEAFCKAADGGEDPALLATAVLNMLYKNKLSGDKTSAVHFSNLIMQFQTLNFIDRKTALAVIIKAMYI